MDPLTQGALGAVAAQVVCGRRLPRSAWIIGWAAGMAADLDVLIPAGGDPLGGMGHHRHFTHSLAFIPIGGLLAALPFLVWPVFRRSRGAVLLAAVVAYATHGLLDACTSFGTVLWWPFSDARVAWDVIGIIDPVYTLILLVGLTAAALRRRRREAAVALGCSLAYLGVGFVQHERGLAAQRELAAQRGHEIEHGRVLPTPLNLVLWRSVYVAQGRIHADSIRTPWLSRVQVRAGTSAEHVTPEVLERLRGPQGDQLAAALRRFDWFTDGFVAFDERAPDMLGDMRYCSRPDEFSSMWGLHLAGAEDEAGEAWFGRSGPRRRDGVAWMWSALLGRDPAFAPLAMN